MNVLVATPAKTSTPIELLQGSDALYSSLTWEEKHRALYINEAGGTRHVRHARARNQLVERYLKPEHTHILWLDVDVVKAPWDLIEKLAEVGEEHVVAPFVLLDGTVGGVNKYPRFYDVNSFVKDGKMFTPTAPYCQDRGGPIIELDSVGTCYLIPAEVYRQGARYVGIPDEVEHLALMQQARAMGYKVFARRDVVVWHANLPLMGYDWADKDKPTWHKERR